MIGGGFWLEGLFGAGEGVGAVGGGEVHLFLVVGEGEVGGGGGFGVVVGSLEFDGAGFVAVVGVGGDGVLVVAAGVVAVFEPDNEFAAFAEDEGAAVFVSVLAGFLVMPLGAFYPGGGVFFGAACGKDGEGCEYEEN